MRLLISGGRVIDPANKIDQPLDLVVIDGKISELRPPGKFAGEKFDETIDASGLLVAPGLIDMHVHLREPGYEYKETIASGAEAAVAGGFTTIACMPNTNPVNDSAAITEFILDRARAAGFAKVLPVGAVTVGLQGERLSEIGELAAGGAVAISDDGRPVPSAALSRLALEYASAFNLPVLAHCEEPSMIGGHVNEGYYSTKTGLAPIPNASEDIIVAREIILAELTGGRLHICHVSTAGAVELIRRAKDKGLAVTAEATPHHFTLTDEAVIDYDANTKMNPPLRSEADREAIIAGLADGTIDCIATDHAPHSIQEKEIEFNLALNGIVGLETALPLSLKLVRDGRLDFSGLIERMSLNPARALGIAAGTLSPGADADITIIDPNAEWTIDPKQFKSKGRNTPFAGTRANGRAVTTIVQGKVFS